MNRRPPPRFSRDATEALLAQLARRPAVWIAGGLLLLLYAVAVYAPLLASDRPLAFEGIDREAYGRALRQVRGVSAGLLERARAGPQTGGGAAGGSADGGPGAGGPADGFERALGAERRALELRIAVLERQLAPAEHELLGELRTAADRLVARALATTARPDASLDDQGTALLSVATRVADELRPAEPGTLPEPGRTVALVPFRAYPVLAELSVLEIYLMVLWALLLAWPVWNPAVDRWLLGGDRLARRRARRPKLALVVLLPLLPALLAAAGERGAGATLQSSDWKTRRDQGALEVVRLQATPVPFGMAEQNLSEVLRPPTWHSSALVDEQGYALSGARARRTDPASGLPLHRAPVEVRAGEPDRNSPWRHPLGTDTLGRDLLARLVWGARISLSVGLLSTLLLVVIGTALGALAGYCGGSVDLVVSRVIEVFQCFPVFFLILIVVALRTPSVLTIMLAIGLFRWTGVARLVRGEFLRLRGQEFVIASRALGVSGARTVFRHVLPNALGPVLVAATFQVAAGILTESALSFLGFGVQAPVPSWGSLLTESRRVEHWWIQVFPGALIFVTVMLYNLLGESVRDALDPRLREV